MKTLLSTIAFAFAAAATSVIAAPAQAATPAPASKPSVGGYLQVQRHAITQLINRYGQALNASDVNGVVALYTADGALLAQNSPTAVGTDALRASYEGTFGAIGLNIGFQIAEIRVVAPDWAIARTTSSGTIRIVATGDVVPESNQELFVLRKVGGEWKIARYAFSTMLPPAR